MTMNTDQQVVMLGNEPLGRRKGIWLKGGIYQIKKKQLPLHLKKREREQQIQSPSNAENPLAATGGLGV